MRTHFQLLLSASILCGLAVPGATAAAGSTPFAYTIDHCESSLWYPLDAGGCSAGISGTITAACDEAGCDFTIEGQAQGVRGSGTPAPAGVDVHAHALTRQDNAQNEFQDNVHTSLCRGEAVAEAVLCDVSATLHSDHQESWNGQQIDECAFIGLDVASRSYAGTDLAYTPLAPTHVADSASTPNDEGPRSPYWEACPDGDDVVWRTGVWYG